MDVKKYFDRLGLELPDPVVADSELLRKVHLAHCCRIPYENVDMIRGIPTSLEEEGLFRKIVEEGKGGICFELNGSFGYLLTALGYKVTDYAARYLRGESTIPMRRHRVMKVEATDGVWLCDVGIGEVAQREPIAMVEGLEQEQFGETYKLLKEEDLGWVLWDLHKGQWRKFYSFTEEVQQQADFIALNFYCEKHPDSPFNKDEMFALKTAEGRKTLDGHIYKEFKNGEVFVKELTDEEMPWAYAQFGLKQQ
jgi:N-hydroxyarylamine O-acetyltransferase